MDNLGKRIFLIERIEVNPYSDIAVYNMNYFKITGLINNLEFISDFNTITTNNPAICYKNFKFNIKNTFVLMNDEALKYLNHYNYRNDYNLILKQTLIDRENINYYVLNYYSESDNLNYFIIAISIDVDKLNDDFYTKFDKLVENRKSNIIQDGDKNNQIFLNYLLTQLKYHFEETNNITNSTCENMTIYNMICKSTQNYTTHKSIEQPVFVKNPLYLYQRCNIYWMLQRENETKQLILDDDMIVNWGHEKEFNFAGLTFIPKRNLSNYSKETNSFHGGCLCDDAGLGKTMQIFVLCFSSPSDNLIVVPNHLYEHWFNEFEKHINIPKYANFTLGYKHNMKNMTLLISYDELKNITDRDIIEHKWTRIIVDEYHEAILNKQLYSNICSINAKFKWAVTATPFINTDMIQNIMNFIAKNKIKHKHISKFKMYLDLFADMFRKNTKKSIEQEVTLPKIKEISYYLNFTDKERLMYDTIHNDNRNDFHTTQRYFCINPNLLFTEKNKLANFVELNLLDDEIKSVHHEQHINALNKLFNVKRNIVQKITNNPRIEDPEDIERIIKFMIEKKEIGFDDLNKINDAIQNITEIEHKMKYFNDRLVEINKNKTKTIVNDIEYTEIKLDDTECGICLGEIDKHFTLLQCGHMFCTECIQCIIQASSSKCPMCKLNLKDTVMYTTKKKQIVENLDLVDKYGTKIANLINICNNTEGKIVLFSFSPTLLSNIIKILNDNMLSAESIDKMSVYDFEKNNTKILVLSSDNNASGLNIICASTIIILEPLKQDYMHRKEIERQIIGRLHRIGQTKEIKFIRLIVNNTIEHTIDIENKINDAINEGNDIFNPTIEKIAIT